MATTTARTCCASTTKHTPMIQGTATANPSEQELLDIVP